MLHQSRPELDLYLLSDRRVEEIAGGRVFLQVNNRVTATSEIGFAGQRAEVTFGHAMGEFLEALDAIRKGARDQHGGRAGEHHDEEGSQPKAAPE